MYNITLIKGDGIGPEISEAVLRIIDSAGVKINWDVQTAGADVIDTEGVPLPERVIESVKKNKIALKSPVTTPIGKGFRSVNVQLRKELDLYANLRPCYNLPNVKTRYDNVDLVVEPYINGIPCYCVIMKNKNNYYSCLVEKDGIVPDKKDLIINNVNIFNFEVKFSNLKIYNGTILEGVYKYQSNNANESKNMSNINEEFFIVNDIYYLNGENMINVSIINKFFNFGSYIRNFGMGKFNIFLNNYLTFEDPDKIENIIDNVVIKNKNMSLDLNYCINGYSFYSLKTGKILTYLLNKRSQKVYFDNIKKVDDIKFVYDKQKVKEEGHSLIFFCVDNIKLFLAMPIEYSPVESKVKCEPYFICNIEENEIDNMVDSKYKFLECKITNKGIIPFKYSLQKTPNKVSELVELLEF